MATKKKKTNIDNDDDSLNITTITYQRIKNLGDFENERIEITMEVKNNDPDATLDKGKYWVERKLAQYELEKADWK